MLFMVSYSFRWAAGLRGEDAGTVASPGGHHGFVLAESDDAVAIGNSMQDWTDILAFDMVPVRTDEDVIKVIGA